MRRFVGSLMAAIVSMGAFVCSATDNAPVALKTNLLYDALLNANLGIELRLAPKWSLDVSGNYNGWSLSHGRQWKHWMIQPEARYWTGKAMKGTFLAGHLLGGEFNTTLNGARRQGWAAGLGIGIGHAWHFGEHWGLEAEIAAGYARYAYDKYPCAACGRKIAHRNRNYVGPTKASLSLVYYFGGKKKEPVEPVIAPPIIPVVDTVVPPPAPDFRFKLVDVPKSRILSEQLSGEARVQFAVNSTILNRDLGGNGAELGMITSKMDSIRNDLGMQVVGLELTGYASPEGPRAGNERLAAGRVEALRDFLQQECNLPSEVMSVNYVAEDWQGLRQAIDTSNLPDKQQLLDIADGPKADDAKEAAMRRHKASWSYIMKNVMPALRRTQFRIDYEHRYEEVETQTLEQVNRAISAGDAEHAASLLVDIPSSPEADYARGLVAALRGNYDEAEAWLKRASARGVKEADDALGQIRRHLSLLKD